ncbi:MAG: SDR family oxidoreductase [Verrucomicrobia bacterium]|nr:SDR family oxidoreductase [Verrucomicrobiota bacterium]MCF7708157.1 SDR family oxidoreductase [Verrucomicrobiota bacterium]
MTLQTAVITGGGSGVGRATALLLANHRFRVFVAGRTESKLIETRELLESDHDRITPFACDISDQIQVNALVEYVISRSGRIDALINSAGTNVPERSLSKISIEDYRKTLETNLTGAFLCARDFLPLMRKQGYGTIVNINSDAGKSANAKAGAAYVASKFALAGLTQSINAEERRHGIRACSIFPGDINTPLLDKRSRPPSDEQRARMLQPEDVAECVRLAITLPQNAVVEELLIRPL